LQVRVEEERKKKVHTHPPPTSQKILVQDEIKHKARPTNVQISNSARPFVHILPSIQGHTIWVSSRDNNCLIGDRHATITIAAGDCNGADVGDGS